jgi:hypothetical protein
MQLAIAAEIKQNYIGCVEKKKIRSRNKIDQIVQKCESWDEGDNKGRIEVHCQCTG